MDSGDAGSSVTAMREPGSVGLLVEALQALDFPPMKYFPLEQSRDNTLCFAFDQVRSVDGAPGRCPLSSVLFYYKRLYQVCRDTQTWGRSNPIVGSKEPPGNGFPGGAL